LPMALPTEQSRKRSVSLGMDTSAKSQNEGQSLPLKSSHRSISEHHATSHLSCTRLILLLGTLVLVGAANFAMFKSMYNAYGEKNAYFVSQGVNLLYVIYGGLLVYPRQIFCAKDYEPIRHRRRGNDKSPAQSSDIDPKLKFLVMGILDCFGTFFTAMGAVYTPGVFQTLLNQTLIPCTMFFSYLILRSRYNLVQMSGALVIFLGAAVTILPAIFSETDRASKQFRWYACLIYFFSNVPMAISSVYKEMSFRNQKIDVFYLTQWVSIFQLLVGFVLAPLQNLPGFGTSAYGDAPDIWTQLRRGKDCWLEISKQCEAKSTFWLLPGYVGINFVFNTLGLYLTKRSSAVLTSIAYALLLPVTTITFSLDILGAYQEKITKFTWIGLSLTISGFLLYRWATPRSRAARKKKVIYTKAAPFRDRSGCSVLVLTEPRTIVLGMVVSLKTMPSSFCLVFFFLLFTRRRD